VSDNSPRYRALWSKRNGPDVDTAPNVRFMFSRPPFSAVVALFRSLGYERVNAGPADGARWLNHRMGEWVPFMVAKLGGGAPTTRWIRSAPGQPLQWNDGSAVPRKQVMGWSLRVAKYERGTA